MIGGSILFVTAHASTFSHFFTSNKLQSFSFVLFPFLYENLKGKLILIGRIVPRICPSSPSYHFSIAYG
uniref:Uncharacterized protein n=1 Tax=Rhizophora mucronata TaxID=61149 RepID=A0A2P2LDQ3_RHIMU